MLRDLWPLFPSPIGLLTRHGQQQICHFQSQQTESGGYSASTAFLNRDRLPENRGKRALKGADEVRSKSKRMKDGPGWPQEEPKQNTDPENPKGLGSTGTSTTLTAYPRGGLESAQSSAFISGHDPATSNVRQQLKPTRFRRGAILQKGIDLDSWFTILRFSDPAQLLEMRTKIASCYRFLRDNPTLWKHSRSYHYGDDLPDPPSELTEFQYAHLRHGLGCMSCGIPSTRKTYWAFLRRWCKNCLQAKTIKEQNAMTYFKDENGEDISFLQKCLPSGTYDSWGNFHGVGPAHTHALKTVYLLADVQELVADFKRDSKEDPATWHTEMRTWMADRTKIVEERRAFARKIELWEEMTRSSKSFDHQGKKDARRRFFIEKAKKLDPPITLREMMDCPSYKRAIAIPKEPSMASWLQLQPKLTKEAADLRANPAQGNIASLLDPTTIDFAESALGHY